MRKAIQLLCPVLLVVLARADPGTTGISWSNPSGQTQGPVPSGTQPAGNASPQPRYSRKQLSALLRDAKTIEQHEQLAVYFRLQERELLKQEAHQLEVLADYLEDPRRYPSKYPTRGDNAKSRAAHYHLQADKAAGLAREHERQAEALRAQK